MDGAEAALAVRSLANVLAQDEALKGGTRTIALVTDRLYPADDFATFLDVSAALADLLANPLAACASDSYQY